MPTHHRDDQELMRYLLRTADQLGVTSYVAPYRELLERLIREGQYGANEEEDDRETFMEQAEMAQLLCDEIGLGVVSISAVLLEPPYIRGAVTAQEVEALCPPGTLPLIERLAQTHELYHRYDLRQADQGEEFLLTIAEDIRVVLILLVECLNKLIYAKERMDESRRVLLAQVAQVLFVPTAHRLGLYKIKSQMEDLIFKYTDPKHYYEIKDLMGQTIVARQAYMDAFVAPIQKRLEELPLRWPYTIKSRSKTFTSIMNKMRNKGVAFEEIHDLSAMRIIIDAPPEEEYEACWLVYSIVTDLYTPNTKRLRDWISQPKANGYESLQITVQGPEGKSVEIQIRTTRMDRIAESGMAAHWRYKGVSGEASLDSQLTSMRQVIEDLAGDKEKANAQLSLRVESRDIFVFTPTGQMIRLPKGATVLDFAFAIHSNVGLMAQSAQVNGKRAKLRDKLKNGDVVNITTAKNQRPSIDWLQSVTTRKAKNKIRQAIRDQQESGLQAGKELLERRFKNRHLVYQESIFTSLLRKMGYKGNMDFFIDLSEERVNVPNFLDQYAELCAEAEARAAESRRVALTPTAIKAPEAADGREIVVSTADFKGLEYTLANCCNPKMGDEIFAYPSKSGLKIHTRSCPNAIDILGRHGDRVLPARWRGMESSAVVATLYVTALHDAVTIGRVVSTLHQADECSLINEEQQLDGGLWHGTFTFREGERQTLFALQAQLQSIKGVQQVRLQQ